MTWQVERGSPVFVPGDHQGATGARLRREKELAERTRDHLWAAIGTYKLTPTALAGMRGQPLHLDSESLMSMDIGCLVCEELYDPRLRLRRCPGEPR